MSRRPEGKITTKGMRKAIKATHEEHFQRMMKAEGLLDSGRAGKLLKKGKPFIVVAHDEPYYLDVYRLIRWHERQKDRWTVEDESAFQIAMSYWMERCPIRTEAIDER